MVALAKSEIVDQSPERCWYHKRGANIVPYKLFLSLRQVRAPPDKRERPDRSPLWEMDPNRFLQDSLSKSIRESIEHVYQPIVMVSTRKIGTELHATTGAYVGESSS
jgi:hypothetical protein